VDRCARDHGRQRRGQISKKDEERFRNPDELLSQIHFDTYVSSSGKVTGLIVRNVDAKVAATFGVAAGEVLLEINGRPVRSRMQAMEIGKNDYKRGVRTFITKWMANGAVIERTFPGSGPLISSPPVASKATLLDVGDGRTGRWRS
jgi:hypothetical protein